MILERIKASLDTFVMRVIIPGKPIVKYGPEPPSLCSFLCPLRKLPLRVKGSADGDPVCVQCRFQEGQRGTDEDTAIWTTYPHQTYHEAPTLPGNARYEASTSHVMPPVSSLVNEPTTVAG